MEKKTWIIEDIYIVRKREVGRSRPKNCVRNKERQGQIGKEKDKNRKIKKEMRNEMKGGNWRKEKTTNLEETKKNDEKVGIKRKGKKKEQTKE